MDERIRRYFEDVPLAAETRELDAFIAEGGSGQLGPSTF
jgi:hypothetical protein